MLEFSGRFSNVCIAVTTAITTSALCLETYLSEQVPDVSKIQEDLKLLMADSEFYEEWD
jgi:hypothetical protein